MKYKGNHIELHKRNEAQLVKDNFKLGNEVIEKNNQIIKIKEDNKIVLEVYKSEIDFLTGEIKSKNKEIDHLKTLNSILIGGCIALILINWVFI